MKVIDLREGGGLGQNLMAKLKSSKITCNLQKKISICISSQAEMWHSRETYLSDMYNFVCVTPQLQQVCHVSNYIFLKPQIHILKLTFLKIIKDSDMN